jgi:uncharacterized protein (DUF849 family)
MNKVIISCAITGSLHVPTMSQFLPITPEEIATEAIAAAKAGAAVIHLHARNPEDGRPTPDPKVFMQFLPRIHAETDAVINITTGGAPGMSLEQRIAAARAVSPELASLNMGSFSIGLFPMASRFTAWRYPWEQPFLAATEDMVFKNTFADMKWIIQELSKGGTRFECECYDLGHLYNIAHLVDAGFLKPPLFIQSVLGILGGIGATPANVQIMRTTADSLFGTDYVWSLFGAGKAQMGTCTLGALMGGMVRVGLEDSIYLAKGRLANSNAEQVLKIRRILEELSLEIATADEARTMLSLKGKAGTNL